MDENGTHWLSAKVVGTDLLTDTALLQLTEVPEQPLAVVAVRRLGADSPGDWVMAIGNPFSLSNTVTVGVVSAIGRQQRTPLPERFEEMIQTDAAINRGNSGGPLLNIRGEVVGMNTQIFSDDGGGNLGIGFAVPINTIRDILPQLDEGQGRARPHRRESADNADDEDRRRRSRPVGRGGCDDQRGHRRSREGRRHPRAAT